MNTASVKSPEGAQDGGGPAEARSKELPEQEQGRARHPRLRKETDTATGLNGGAELSEGTSSGADSDSRCVGVVRT